MLINLLSFTVNVEYVLRIRFREFHSFDEIFIEALKKIVINKIIITYNDIILLIGKLLCV